MGARRLSRAPTQDKAVVSVTDREGTGSLGVVTSDPKDELVLDEQRSQGVIPDWPVITVRPVDYSTMEGEMKRMKKRSSLVVLTVLGMLVGLLPLTAVPALATTGDMVIAGVIDGPLTGGTPKAIELYVVNDIADLSIYGVGSANNGGGSDGEEFTLPAGPASAGTYLYVASESPQFTNFFGFAPTYTSAAASINGDDAIELFMSGAVVDVFGQTRRHQIGTPNV